MRKKRSILPRPWARPGREWTRRMPSTAQARIDRALRQRRVAEADHVVEEIALSFCQPHGHRPLPARSYTDSITLRSAVIASIYDRKWIVRGLDSAVPTGLNVREPSLVHPT